MYSRKTKLIALFAVLIAVVIYGWKKEWFGTGGIKGGVWDAVPENSCMVAEIPDWKKLQASMDTLTYGAALDQAMLGQTIRHILSEYNKLSAGKSAQTSSSFLTSYHLAKVGQLDVLLILEDGDLARTCSKKLKKTKDGSVTSYQYKQRKIFQRIDSLGNKLTITIINDMMLASYTSFLVEDAIAQLLVGNSLVADARDMLLAKGSVKGDLRILNYFPNSPLWLGGFMSSQEVKQRNDWSSFANASLLDVYLLPGAIKAEGNTLVGEGNILQQFTQPVVLPGTLPMTKSIRPISFVPAPGNRMERFYARWLTGAGWEIKIPSLSGKQDKQLLFFQSLDNANRMDSLLVLLGVKLPPGKSTVEMLKIPAGWQKKVLGKTYLKTDSIWLLMADSARIALSQEAVPLETWQWVKAEARLKVPGEIPGKQEAFSYYFSNNYQPVQRDSDDESKINNIYANLQSKMNTLFVSMGVAESGMAKTAVTIHFDNTPQDTTIIPWWSAEVPVNIIAGPFIVQDTGGVTWILAQDSLKMAYCWDIDGKVLWKKQLDAPIAGNVFALDYYRNGQMQVMLATARTVYCFNQKGTQAGGYPLRLAGTAAAIAHAGNDANGRFYITTTTGDIYGFELNGRPLQGMSPLKAGAKSIPANIDLKSGILLTTGKDGTCKGWKQDGKLAWTVKLKAKTDPVLVERDSSGVAWAVVLDNGNIAFISPDGKVVTGKFSAQSAAGIYDPDHGWSAGKGQFTYSYLTGETIFSIGLPGNAVVSASAKVGERIGLFTNNGPYWLDIDARKLTSAGKGQGAIGNSFFWLSKPGIYGFAAVENKKSLKVWLTPAPKSSGQ